MARGPRRDGVARPAPSAEEETAVSVLYVHTPLRPPLSFSVGASAPIVDVLKEVQRELPALSDRVERPRCGLYHLCCA